MNIIAFKWMLQAIEVFKRIKKTEPGLLRRFAHRNDGDMDASVRWHDKDKSAGSPTPRGR